MKTDEHQKALDHILSANRIRPNEPRILYLWAKFLQSTGLCKHNFRWLVLSVFHCYCGTGEYEEALQKVSEAQRYLPTNADLMNLARDIVFEESDYRQRQKIQVVNCSF